MRRVFGTGRMRKKILARGSAQPTENIHFGRENPRNSKTIQSCKTRDFAELEPCTALG